MEKLYSPEFLEIKEIFEMGLYEVPMSLLGFGMGIMLANFHVCAMMVLFNAMLYILVRYVSPRGPMCFRCLVLNLSGPVELLFWKNLSNTTTAHLFFHAVGLSWGNFGGFCAFCHVRSMGISLDFRADGLGYKHRFGLTMHISCVLWIKMSI